MVPYEIDTGKVFLNAIGSNQETAAKPFVDGAFEAYNEIDFATAELILVEGISELDQSLFPCIVPLDSSGVPFLEGIGSSATEARINVEYANREPGEFSYHTGALKMTIPLPDLADQPILRKL